MKTILQGSNSMTGPWRKTSEKSAKYKFLRYLCIAEPSDGPLIDNIRVEIKTLSSSSFKIFSQLVESDALGFAEAIINALEEQ